ncbi:MAG: NTP transferase domain-containing protein [Acetobacteraceae bacterium]
MPALSAADARAPGGARPVVMVLAGGLGTRMGGGDKALRRVGTATLLEHVLARLAGQASRIVLNANGDPARFAGFGLPVLADSVPDHPGRWPACWLAWNGCWPTRLARRT